MSTESHIQAEVSNLINQYEDGNIGVLDVVIKLRRKKAFFEEMQKHIKDFEKENEDAIQDEALQYNNQYKGATFEFRSGGKSFVYAGIKEIDDLEKQLNQKKELYKTAWENKQKGLLAATEDGEELQMPKVKYRASSMIVKLPK